MINERGDNRRYERPVKSLRLMRALEAAGLGEERRIILAYSHMCRGYAIAVDDPENAGAWARRSARAAFKACPELREDMASLGEVV